MEKGVEYGIIRVVPRVLGKPQTRLTLSIDDRQ